MNHILIRGRGGLLAAAALVATAAPAGAAFITGTVTSGNLTTVIPGGAVVNFEGVPVHMFTNEVIDSVRFLRINAGSLSVESAVAGTMNTRGTRYLSNNAGTARDFRFDFTAGPVREFAFLWGGSDRPWDVRVFSLGGQLLEQHLGSLPVTGASNNGTYAGIRRNTADIGFVTIFDPAGFGDTIYLDNLTYSPGPISPTPAPASAVLIGMGFAGLAGIGVLRRQTTPPVAVA